MTAAGELQPCPPGFDVAEVMITSSRQISSFVTPFPCADGVGMVTTHPSNRDSNGVFVRISRSLGGEVFGTSGAPGVLISPTGTPFETTLVVITDRGSVGVSWTFTQAGMPRTCEEIGVMTTQVDFIPSTGLTVTEIVPCPYFQTGARLPSGPARVVISAGSASGSASASSDVVVPMGGLSTTVAPINLSF